MIRVLVLSDLYPTAHRPDEGAFVWRMAKALQADGFVRPTVVALRRVFPEWHLVRGALHGDWARTCRYYRHWKTHVPLASEVVVPGAFDRICYTGLPRRVGQATWGRAAWWFGRKTLRSLHRQYQFDLVHAHFATASGRVAQLFSENGGPPFVLSIHGYELAFTVERCPGGKKLVQKVIGASRAVIVNSLRTRERVLALGGMDPDKVRLIYQGGEVDGSTAIRPYTNRSGPHELNVLTVGGLERQKGQEVVLRAVARLQRAGIPIRCTFVGDGNDRRRLCSLVRELNISDRVAFVGSISPQEIGSYYAKCDAFVLPSWNEAFGVVYVEAMHFGKPLVGCTGEGGPEDLAAAGAGIVRIAKGDDAALSSILAEWARHPELAEQIGRKNQEIARREYSWNRHAERLAGLYEEILKDFTPKSFGDSPLAARNVQRSTSM